MTISLRLSGSAAVVIPPLLTGSTAGGSLRNDWRKLEDKLAVNCKVELRTFVVSEIYSSSLDQVQQKINKDADLVFDALIAADYNDEIECLDGSSQQNA